MLTIFNNSAILVDINDDAFIVEDLSTREKKELPQTGFFGTVFKYESAFHSAFLDCFSEKSNIFITERANEVINNMINFNRVDY